ncbi:hypothetical protein GQ457_01G048330 [Hibiscus cannabinus]
MQGRNWKSRQQPWALWLNDELFTHFNGKEVKFWPICSCIFLGLLGETEVKSLGLWWTVGSIEIQNGDCSVGS